MSDVLATLRAIHDHVAQDRFARQLVESMTHLTIDELNDHVVELDRLMDRGPTGWVLMWVAAVSHYETAIRDGSGMCGWALSVTTTGDDQHTDYEPCVRCRTCKEIFADAEPEPYPSNNAFTAGYRP